MTSVKCSPVSLNINQLSIVPKQTLFISKFFSTSGTFLINQRILDKEKYVAIGSPVLLNSWVKFLLLDNSSQID